MQPSTCNLQPPLPIAPPRAPSRCCWGEGCIHCREAAAERARITFTDRARVRQRTDAQRRELGLLPRNFGQQPRSMERNANIGALGLVPSRATRHPSRTFGSSVLPANFQLTGV